MCTWALAIKHMYIGEQYPYMFHGHGVCQESICRYYNLVDTSATNDTSMMILMKILMMMMMVKMVVFCVHYKFI